MEPTTLPSCIEHPAAVVVGDVERTDVLALDVAEGARRGVATLEHLRVAGLGLGLHREVEPLLSHWQCRHRGSLEHGQVVGDLGRLLGHLDPAGPGADDPHPPASHCHTVLWPLGRVMAGAGEVVEAGQVGNVGLRSEPGAHQQEAGVIATTVVGGDRPLVPTLVERRGRDPRAQIDVPAQIEHPIDVLEVADELVSPGEPLGPDPIPPHRFDRVLVVRDVGVDTGSGIAVRVPHPAQPGPGLDEPSVEPFLAEAVELV